MFKKESEINTEFLPGISFKYLWQCDISDSTRETIWKYLQLILISIIGCVKNRDAFGDTAKLFQSINEDEFKGKRVMVYYILLNQLKDGQTKMKMEIL